MWCQLSQKENMNSSGSFLETEKTSEEKFLWAFPFLTFWDDLLERFTCIYLGYWDICYYTNDALAGATAAWEVLEVSPPPFAAGWKELC